ncbi:MAG: IS1595 family transposase [Bacteroidetes bacterium]|nr:IS1595 family transposase [Bacteroidota bacterium]
MTLLEFSKKFPTEKSCRLHFKSVRDKQGVVCKKCNHTDHYWLQYKEQYQCKQCKFRTTLRSGTIMESSNMPFKKWYIAMMFMSATKKGFSSSEIQRQMKHKRYEPVWAMVHKLRKAMGKREDLYKLNDIVEFDEGHFEVETSKEKRSNLKRGKGSQRQKDVAVMAESTPLENPKTNKKSSHLRYVKMKVLEAKDADEINKTVRENIDEKSIILSDKATSYIDIARYVEAHITEKSTKETTSTTLKWVHIAIANAKRNFLGIYHKIKGKYLQNYLNEFVYKLNRRYFKEGIFDRLSVAMVCNYG